MSDSNFTTIFGDSDMVPYLKVWNQLQETLKNILRWVSFKKELKEKYPKAKEMREQTTLQHTLGGQFLLDSIVCKINRLTSLMLDEALMLRAFLYHDLPEGIRGIDVPATQKTDDDDLQEYLAFCTILKHMSPQSAAKKKYAYLLQFAYEFPQNFPEEALEVMREIRKNHMNEAIIFSFIERYDYVQYTLEHFQKTDDPIPLQMLLRSYMSKFDAYVELVPELSLIWSPGFKARCQKVLELK